MNQGKCICMAFMNIQLGGVLHNIYTWLNGQNHLIIQLFSILTVKYILVYRLFSVNCTD